MRAFTVVMAGGGGSRFWPLSRQEYPKQLLNLSGRDIMLNDTILRMEPVISRTNAYIVTNAAQEKLTKKLLAARIPKRHVLAEPARRNTAPCILYAALMLKKKYGEAVMCVLPADHFIADEEAYRACIKEAMGIAKKTDGLVTIGIRPDCPATGYGYIACGEKLPKTEAYRAAAFREKPDRETAKGYLSSGNYLWNAGIFVWKISSILAAYQAHLPAMYEEMMKLYDDIGTKYETQRLESVYPLLENISVDYGIMEKAEEVYVLPCDCGWNDVGSLDALALMLPKDTDGNAIRGNAMVQDSKGCIVSAGKRLVAVTGCEDLMVIDTEDALLVCPKDRAQDVRKIAERLETEQRSEG